MRLRILNPCPVDFNAMREDEARASGAPRKARYCEKCNKHVYDLTCMSGDDVRTFVSRRGRICGRVAAAALALTGCSAADQTAQTTVQIGPLTAPPPRADAGVAIDDQPMMGEIEVSH